MEIIPFDGRRVRAAFDFANLWGEPIRSGLVPTARLRLARENFYLWGALRGYPLLNYLTLENFVAWNGLLGGGVRLGELCLEATLGYSDRGSMFQAGTCLPLRCGEPGSSSSTARTASRYFRKVKAPRLRWEPRPIFASSTSAR